MKHFLIAIIIFTFLMLSGCQSQSRIIIPSPTIQDPNAITDAYGPAADTLAQQIADNLKNEAGRISDLFKYNSFCFIGLFITMLGGVAFAILTRSSWGWIIPTVSLGGIVALIAIVQLIEYIKWITLGILVLALGVLIYKTYEYQKERNTNLKKEKVNV